MRSGQWLQRLRCLSVGRVQPLLQARYGIDLLVERLRVLSPVKHKPLRLDYSRSLQPKRKDALG